MAEPTKLAVAAAPAPGSPEYDAAMAAKAAGTEPEKKPEGENLILGKFKTPEDLATAYKELEAKLGKPPEKKDEPAQKPEDLKVAEQAQDVLAKAGLKQEDLAASFQKDGKLTDEQYQKLKDVGVSKDMVDAYISGQQAKGDQLVTNVQALAGGKEQFTAMIAWAKNNASPDQVKAYNDAIDSGDMGRIALAVNAFNGAYKNANPTLVGGAPGTVVSGYRSTAEMTAAMRDPRYGKDEAYRADVMQRVSAMTFASR